MSIIGAILGRGKEEFPRVPKIDSFLIFTKSGQYFVWKTGGHWMVENHAHPNHRFVCVGFIEQDYKQLRTPSDSSIISPMPPVDNPDSLNHPHHIRAYPKHKSMLFMQDSDYNNLVSKHKKNQSSPLSDLINLSNKTSTIQRIYHQIA